MTKKNNSNKKSHIVTFLTPTEADELKKELESDNYIFSGNALTIFSAKNLNINVAYYKSGKLLVQGQEIDVFLDRYLKHRIASKYKEPVIGTDESGKGDYFGPLVVAAVSCDWKSAEKFVELSVQDSKNLSDNSIMVAAAKIQSIAPHAVVTINPARYNELWRNMRNVNKILAWAHARAIENLLEKQHANTVIADQFGHERLVKNALLGKGKKVNLVQRSHGEEELPVAAASVVARALFLSGLKQLSQKFGVEFPKGAAIGIEEVAKEFTKKHSTSLLSQVAKLHFKTTSRVVNAISEMENAED
ncbi:MAG: ribonuclease HIII [Planctomycetota bacterium]